MAKRIPKKRAKPLVAAKKVNARVVTHQIENWSEFVSIVQSWQGVRNWCFRGQGEADWELQPSLARHIEVSKVHRAAWKLQEERIRRIFKRKSHLFISDPPKGDEFEWLALMQHHGAPTRLLDFTWSPYVAAFFALERATKDSAIWALNLPLLWDVHGDYSIDGLLVGEANPRDPAAFEKYYMPNAHAFVWQGDPFRMPQRVVAQSGTFLVSSHLGMTVEDILALYPGSGELLIKFVLPTATLRAEAMASLYSMNITQATLFPGLDGLARSMAYEFEYSWEVDLQTNETFDPRRDKAMLDRLRASDHLR